MEGLEKMILVLTLYFLHPSTGVSQCSRLECLRTGSTLWANGEVCNNNIIRVRSGEPFCLGAALRSRNPFRDWKATSRITIQNVTFPNTYSVKPYMKPRITADNTGKADTCYTYTEYPLVETETPGAQMLLKWTDSIAPVLGSDSLTQTHECFIQVM